MLFQLEFSFTEHINFGHLFLQKSNFYSIFSLLKINRCPKLEIPLEKFCKKMKVTRQLTENYSCVNLEITHEILRLLFFSLSPKYVKSTSSECKHKSFKQNFQQSEVCLRVSSMQPRKNAFQEYSAQQTKVLFFMTPLELLKNFGHLFNQLKKLNKMEKQVSKVGRFCKGKI